MMAREGGVLSSDPLDKCAVCGRSARSRAPLERVAGGWVCADSPGCRQRVSNLDVIERLIEAVRRADRIFESEGGSSRHYVRDCLLPMLAECGLEVRPSTDQGAVEALRELLDASEAAAEATAEYEEHERWRRAVASARARLGGQ